MSCYYQNLRLEHTKNTLNKKDLADNPFAQFDNWFNEAANNIKLANAMSLATADKTIGIRTVLLKHFDKNGFVFFSNYNSNKAKQIKNNPQAALLFPWLALDRQVSIVGSIKKISTKESIKYFITRPIESQISAIASKQSIVIDSKKTLLNNIANIKIKISEIDFNKIKFWGGYIVQPKIIEFWQGGKNRLHDRFVYELENNIWKIKRLSP